MSSETPTLFIVGAGASTDLGFPAGPRLATNIASRLAYTFERNRVIAEDQVFFSIASRVLYDDTNISTALWTLASQITNTVKLAPSIDNFLDLHQNEKKLLLLGKTAIAYEIAQQEGKSAISTASPQGFTKFINSERISWYLEFFRAITERCSFSDLPCRLRCISVITFNYDRSLEQFLMVSVSALYAVSIKEAGEALKGLLIYHPYGSLGPLEAQDQVPGLPYGSPLRTHDFKLIAQRIRTFTEGAEEDDPLKLAAADRLVAAKRIVFLGFGYLSANMQLLRSMRDSRSNGQHLSRNIYGTTLGLSAFNTSAVRYQVADLFNVTADSVNLDGIDCGQLLRDFSQGLKFV